MNNQRHYLQKTQRVEGIARIVGATEKRKVT